MAENAQIARILESINQKSKACENELIKKITDEFEDEVSSLGDPLKRAKQSLDKAREDLTKSNKSMEAFEAKVNETLIKFETSIESIESNLFKDTKDVLGNLNNEIAASIENTVKLIETNGSLEESLNNIIQELKFGRDQEEVNDKAVIGKVIEVDTYLKAVREQEEANSGAIIDKVCSLASLLAAVRDEEDANNKKIIDKANSIASDLSAANEQQKANTKELTGKMERGYEQISETLKTIGASVEKDLANHKALINELGKEVNSYKSAAAMLLEKYEEQVKEVNTLKSKFKISIGAVAALVVINLVVSAVILTNVLK
jgi:chromosome segregation ATPase